ncbi:LysM peptidoglycan-binding domain-containing protein [Bacillus sp. AGMB 02131]|uniref:LysM peptidoglycan-binding domain-containing protein n=1 Tax=Peribacillus faecalis TaxID=2772559 RepID=A0A927HCR3_9BACI|nr:C40 family peptidase [Peribacillus faecalis]MBD3109791.1 LysM peptidoglycan-binding domain-containing protein [Peribacillus faecalis]
MKKTIIAGTLAGSLLFSGNALAASYTVKSGDSLWKISKNHNVSISQLKSWNNLSNDTIFPGQILTINSSSSGNTTSSTGNNTNLSTYIVSSGDTFSGIAKKFNLSTSTLKSLNPEVININYLRIGQVLKVSLSSSSPTTGSQPNTNNSTTITANYTVKSGDTFSGIAFKFNISISTLKSLNPGITNINQLRVGQVLKVSGNASNTSSPTTGNTSAPTTSWETKADAIISTGSKYLGKPYLYGASVTQTNAFDCSSFTMRVFQENGITLPRNSVAQSKVGQSVSLSNLRKGDLVFFDTDFDGVINHVAIAMSNTTLIHSQSSVGVSISSLNTYWQPRVVKITRVL